ncbi:Diaminopimelate epimerase-like protein [Mycena albidolilacea]|uniref:Diaminopimelate epimerase-like protein n=1 Tax=Mycena albidolilacea TaxID=1033008 RepID=A0AAD6ZSV0_9AGAR|nr:Diaminopimelate epimerase-like protein [Mycena albidolilacea]
MSPTQLAYTVFDAFTATRFHGNPASVILLQPDHGLSDELLQLIGREFNLSETAFLVPLEDHRDDAPHFSIRWFTPELEAPLCGHATLAAAVYLHQSHPQLQPPYRFESRRSGQLKVDYHAKNDLYELDFPADIPVAIADAAEAAAALELAHVWFPTLARGDIKAISRTGRGYIVEAAETVDVASVAYDTAAIARDIPVGQCVLTGPHKPTPEDPSQVHSRMFACGSGLNEDPVTGSAHTRIVPYWLSKWGGSELKCRQVSARGGDLDTVWLRDEGRVLLRGHGVKTAEGILFL